MYASSDHDFGVRENDSLLSNWRQPALGGSEPMD